MYNSINDARTVLINSGVLECFDFDVINIDDVIDFMYRNDKTPEQAAEHFCSSQKGDSLCKNEANLSVEMNLEALKLACDAVEDNNRSNDANWQDWQSVIDIKEAYGFEVCEFGESVLERAIQSNGASVEDDLAAAHQLVWHNEQPSQAKKAGVEIL